MGFLAIVSTGLTGCETLTVTAPPEEISVLDLGVPELRPTTVPVTAPQPIQTPVLKGGAIVSGGGFVTGNTGNTPITGFTTIGETTYVEPRTGETFSPVLMTGSTTSPNGRETLEITAQIGVQSVVNFTEN